MSDLQLFTPSCPNTWGAYLSETFNTYSEKVVSFGNHYYEQLPTVAQMSQYKDGVFTAAGARFEQASTFARQAAADASVKFGEFSKVAGEFVQQNVPDLNNPQTVEMISKGVIATLVVLNILAFAHTIHSHYTLYKKTQEANICTVEGPVCPLHRECQVVVLPSEDPRGITQFFWQVQTDFDNSFAGIFFPA